MADGTVDLVADDGVERRAQRQRQLLAEAEVGQAQADDHVDRPAVESPVEVGDTHGENRACVVHLVDAGQVGERIVRVAPGHGVVEIEHRFGNAEEQQTDADAGREQHRKPGKGAELRLAVVVAQLDAPEAAEHQVEAREEHHDERAHVVPIERMLDPSADGRIDTVGNVHEEGREYDEGRNHALGRQAHAGVQPLPETPIGDILRHLVWHRPYPSRSACIGIRLRRGSGSGRAAKSASLRLPCLATILRAGQSPSDLQYFRRVRKSQQRKQDYCKSEPILSVPRRRQLPPICMVAYVPQTYDAQNGRSDAEFAIVSRSAFRHLQ